ncbi:MAG TPA: GNAT family N-acetyltransferase [Nitriliruptorales bacterium]
MDLPEPVIRAITPDEREAGRQLRVMAFGSTTFEEPDPNDHYAPNERRIGAFLDDRMIVHTAAWPFRQWWLGRPVPMAGIGGVASAPDVRGRGYGRLAMRGLVDACLELGDVVSTLYPSLPGFYRGLGWEVAGHVVTRRLPTQALTSLPRPGLDVTVRMMDVEADTDSAAAVLDRVASKSHGTVERGPEMHQRRFAPDDDMFQMVAVRDEVIVGYLAATKRSATEADHAPYRLKVHDLAADDHDGWLALWSVIASHAGVCAVTDVVSRPHEPLYDLLPTNAFDDWTTTFPWMFRLLDAPGAIAARGWPAGADAEVHLRVTDPWLDRNDGDWVLRVKGGEGSLEAGGAGTVGLDINTFATMYTGYALPVDLAWQRRLVGATGADVSALTEAFRSPTPWCDTYF